MKKVKLLYEKEYASRMLVYNYDVHSWNWDVKFWLVGNKWCTDLTGNHVVDEIHDEEIEIIREYTTLIEHHEKENQNWLAFHKCKKRTCVCKSCKKICDCVSCREKINDCDKKQLMD